MSRHSRGSWKQLLGYMDRGADENSLSITHNLKGVSIPEWVHEFTQNEAARIGNRKDSVRVFHEVLAFGKLDRENLDNVMLEDLVREYIQLRAERGLVIAISHHETESTHVHLAISGVENVTGKSMRISKQRFGMIKRELQNYQQEKYPQLQHSIVQHGTKVRERQNGREQAMRNRSGQPSRRELVEAQLRQMFDRSGSIHRFKQQITEQGMKLYLRNGRPQGVLVDGIKYRLSTVGIQKENFDAVERTPDRSKQLAHMRQKTGEVEREEPALEQEREQRRKALRGPQQF